MATRLKRPRRLVDAYAFAGFRPLPTVRGVFGDPKARVITLVRRSKKRPVVSAGRVDCRQCGKVKRERLEFLADNPFYTRRFACMSGAVVERHRSRISSRSSRNATAACTSEEIEGSLAII